MIPKAITTESEYEAALARVDSLMEAAPGSAAEDELKAWSILIEKYEEEYFPVERPDSVAATQFRMEQMGLAR